MGSRKMYIFGMLVVPVFMAFFFLDLLSPGLPNRVPTAVVDLDHSTMSRTVTRSLEALQVLDLSERCESYDQALERVRQGKIFGFFVIPADFEKNALSGNEPTLEYYSNMTYFVPGTLAFKGFKTVAVATSGGVVQQTLVSLGATPGQVAALVQPLSLDVYGLNNPWMSYSIYLCPSFTMATFVLMIMLMTVFSITIEIKEGTSPQWLATSHGSILVAVASKLLPQTVIFAAVGIFIQWLFFGLSHFPPQRVARVDDSGHAAYRGCQPGCGAVRIVGGPQSPPGLLADGPLRHIVILVHRLFVPGREHVWLAGHLQLPGTNPLLVPHLYQRGPQRRRSILLALLLRGADCLTACGMYAAAPPA